MELSQPNRAESGRYLTYEQSHPAWLGAILWTIFSVGNAPGAEALQHDVGSLGNAKVQTAKRTQVAGHEANGENLQEATMALRSLGEKDVQCVCLIGAG